MGNKLVISFEAGKRTYFSNADLIKDAKALKELRAITSKLYHLDRYSNNSSIHSSYSYAQGAMKNIRSSFRSGDRTYKHCYIEWKLDRKTEALFKNGYNKKDKCGDTSKTFDVTYEKLIDVKKAKTRAIDTLKIIRQNKALKVTTASKYLAQYNENINVPLVAGVHMIPGFFTRLKESFKAKEVFIEKSPKDNDKYIGIELEFFCKVDKRELARLINEAGLSKHICLKQDGSISPESGYHPHEICILAKESEYKEIVNKTTILLGEVNAKVNKSCGMHVHLDMRNRNKELSYSNLVSSQKFLYALNPKSRKENNRYCSENKNKTFVNSGNRYVGINSTAYRKHGTIEVRIHSGTVSSPKIINWIELLLTIVSKTEEVKRAAGSVKGFLKQFDIKGNLAKYVETRIAKFAEPLQESEAA